MSRVDTPSWSPWALVGLACSVGLCPVVTMLGVVFGLVAMRDVRLNHRRGRRVAIAAIVIGLVVTPVTTGGLAWWNAVVREPLLHGPLEALLEGQAGDPGALLADFQAGTATAAQATDFLNEMGSRFGTLISIEQDPERDAAWDPDGWSISVPYVLQFARDRVPGTARYVILGPRGADRIMVFRFAWVRIGEESPLIFPPGTGGEVETDTRERHAD